MCEMPGGSNGVKASVIGATSARPGIGRNALRLAGVKAGLKCRHPERRGVAPPGSRRSDRRCLRTPLPARIAGDQGLAAVSGA